MYSFFFLRLSWAEIWEMVKETESEKVEKSEIRLTWLSLTGTGILHKYFLGFFLFFLTILF